MSSTNHLVARLGAAYEIQHTGNATLYSMEGLRGFAVLLVFLVHYITLSEPWISGSSTLQQGASLVRSLGNVGVDLFFVLSGYLIYGMLLIRPRPFIPYIRRRIQRIYPTFAAVFAIYLLLSFVFPAKSKLPANPIDASMYVAANFFLLPGMFDIEPIITVAWSLSYEFFFYLTVPLLIGVLRLRTWSSRSRVMFLAALAVLILLMPAAFGGHVRLAMFVAGMLVFEASTYRRPAPLLDGLGLGALGLGLICVVAQDLYGFSGQLKFAALAVSFFLLCWAAFACNGYVARIFQWTPLRWLGNISYSYYLFHGLALNAVFLVLPKLVDTGGNNALLFWIGLPLCFAVTFVASTALFLAIEKPFSLANVASPRHSGATSPS